MNNRNRKVRHFDNFVQRKFAILIIRGIFGRLSKWRTFGSIVRHFDKVLEIFEVTGKKVRHFHNDPINSYGILSILFASLEVIIVNHVYLVTRQVKLKHPITTSKVHKFKDPLPGEEDKLYVA